MWFVDAVQQTSVSILISCEVKTEMLWIVRQDSPVRCKAMLTLDACCGVCPVTLPVTGVFHTCAVAAPPCSTHPTSYPVASANPSLSARPAPDIRHFLDLVLSLMLSLLSRRFPLSRFLRCEAFFWTGKAATTGSCRKKSRIVAVCCLVPCWMGLMKRSFGFPPRQL